MNSPPTSAADQLREAASFNIRAGSHSVRITSLLKWNSCGQQFILQFLGSARRQLAPQEFLDLARFRVEKLCQDFDVVKLPNWHGSPVVALGLR
jgi:hypothetical protein